MRKISLAWLTLLLATSAVVFAQGQKADEAKDETEPGIPVTDKVTVAKCGTCHPADKDGNLTRISWIRTTPEGWQEAIKRMVRLNGVKLEPAEARQIVQYLGTNHGLAPKEASAVSWHLEMRHIQKEELPSDDIREACASCHPLARPQSWYRSKNEWKELVNMHLGYFPVVENNSFRRRRGASPARGTAPVIPVKEPVDLAIEHFTKVNPLHTAEWAAWRSSMREPKLAGRWVVWGTEPGHGRITGEVTIEPGTNPYEFVTKTAITRVASGKKLSFTGRVIVYTGYAWRGRSVSPEDPKEVREVMMVSRDQSEIAGRWFWGAYQEFGINVTMRRAGGGPMLLGADTYSLAAGAAATKMRLLGDHLPTDLKVADIDLGSGVIVKRIVSQTGSVAEIEVDVDAKAVPGPRDLVLRGTVAAGAFAVFDKVDYVKVSADSMLARLGGNTHPKGYAQFEAIGYHRGLDGKPGTADDIELGPVKVKWSVEEFQARYGDDDREFVGSLSDGGLFTPASEGPNPQRRFSANNFGDVWVVASYQPPGGGKPLTAKSYLVVTIPLYVRWDQPEVAE